MTTEEELLGKLEDSTRDATRLQVEALESIIERHGGMRYLQRHLRNYDAPIDVATFRRVVPLSTYEDYSDDINRLADGPPDQDQPLLSVDPLVCFFYSSGTSSLKPKLIPLFDSSLSKSATYIAQQATFAILRRFFNLFNTQVEIVFTAMSTLKYDDIKLGMTETGWPSNENEKEIGAIMENVAAYNNIRI